MQSRYVAILVERPLLPLAVYFCYRHSDKMLSLSARKKKFQLRSETVREDEARDESV